MSAPTTDHPVLQVRDLRVRFPASAARPAVDGISFDLRAGEVLAVVGQSGSGKSVTARALIGLAGEGAEVSAHTLRLHDRPLLDLTPAQWRGIRGREIGFVLQDALTSLDPLRTIGREVGEALHGVPARRRGPQVRAALERAGIPDPDIRAAQHPHQLSGGLRQRALIASAIVADPPVLIADEPTTALDVTVQKRILALLRDLADDGRAILLITHDLAVVAEIADHVLVLQDGAAVESGPVSQVLGSPSHPYTRALLDAVPSGSAPPAPSSEGPPVLEVRDAHVGFRGPRGTRRKALDGVSIEIPAGRTLGVVGESGSGKSTLGRAVLGLQGLDEGTITLFGERWDALPERRRRPHRRRIQTISQDPLGTFDPQLTVARLLEQPLRLRPGLAAGDRRAESLRLLALVDLAPEILETRPRRLSGGQRQRVAIAQALASEPELLIADEPVSALDVITQAQVLDLLARIQADTGLAMLFISHDLGVVRRLSHRIAVMENGRVVESGETEQVLTAPRHPYTAELLDAVPRLDARPAPQEALA